MGSATSLALPLLLLSLFSLLQKPTFADKKSYVVYLGEHPHTREESNYLIDHEKVADAHHEFLGSILGSKDKAQDAIFYSYTRHINGFAANLGEDEAMEISKHPEVISVFPNRGRALHTTHSWSFLGLERDGHVPKKSIWSKAKFGRDIIIANLDTGVWPKSESFNDEGMGSIPSRWRGTCQSGVQCNRKLIGARYFNKGYASSHGHLDDTFNTALDLEGHGTHTLSTAAGRHVPSANIFGYGNGTAKGGSPDARVAAYRVCYPPANGSQCYDADILAAFDAAIADGVDVLSVSLGGSATAYFEDGIAIGAFHAVRHGVTVVCSAGNSGPTAGTVSNVAPWIVTVGASTMDREFPTYVKLGKGLQLKGQSLSPMRLPRKKHYHLIKSEDAKAAHASFHDAQRCFTNSLDPSKVKGKIVACLRGTNARVAKGETVVMAGGIGMILANDITTGNEVIADAHVLPASHISYSDGLALYSYINCTKSPKVYISSPRTVIGTKPAPFMAAFSSQGPNSITPEILKPDVTAPGVSVLASFTGKAGPTNLPFDTRRVRFNSESGTSMSCPHVSGVVGLLKAMHPDWSPAAIKSAIMTSAKTSDNRRRPITNSSFAEATPFNYGSGHIWPNRAMDPGLVYDATADDYLNFLCSINYNSTLLTKFSTKPHHCPSKHRPRAVDFNYPSITVPKLSGQLVVARRLKNVGPPATYKLRLRAPAGVSVSVSPRRLRFERVGEEKAFEVTMKVERSHGGAGKGYRFGRLIWSDGVHYVRSHLVVNLG